MNYPFIGMGVPALLFVVISLIIAIWNYRLDHLPQVFSTVAVPISMVTAWCWYTSLPLWTALVTVILTFTLAAIATRLAEDKDVEWHFAALLISVFGKPLMRLFMWIGDVVSGRIETPVWVWLISGAGTVVVLVLFIFLMFIAIGRLKASRRMKHQLATT